MTKENTPRTRWPKERLSNFTDSIFAFAVTLLVLNVMQTYTFSRTNSLFLYFTNHSSVFFTYTLTFLIVSRFWVSHIRLFALIDEYDRTIVDLNIALLFFITLFPFIAFTLGNHIGNRDAVIMYALCFVAIGFVEYLIGRHAYLHHNLFSNLDDTEPYSLKIFTLYSLSTPLLFIVSILIAFISPIAAEFMWILIFFIRQSFLYYFRNNSKAEDQVSRL